MYVCLKRACIVRVFCQVCRVAVFAACCSVLQRIAVRDSVLQCVAMRALSVSSDRYRVTHTATRTATRTATHTVTLCNTLATHHSPISSLLSLSPHCNTTHCNTLATHCNTPASHNSLALVSASSLSSRPPAHSLCTLSDTQQHAATHLQHTATHYNTLQHNATQCNALHPLVHTTGLCACQHTATRCNTLQHNTLATHLQHTCNTLATHLQHTATHCNSLQLTATHSNTLQHTATRCYTLQHICNTLQHAPYYTRGNGVEGRCFLTATHHNALQHTATHRNTPRHTATHLIRSDGV